MRNFFNILLLLFSLQIQAQTENIDIPNLTPPSPTAYQLGNYGQEKVGLFTGTPQVEIPLYEYKTSNLSVPIFLSYSSNGILVNQISSDVGLGWNLMAGGVISRTARDGSDENNSYFFPEEEISEVGVRSPMAMDFFYEAGHEGADTETDLFSFNFSGYSGRFVIDNDRKIVQVPQSSLKIENYADGADQGYKITTPTGVKYFFLDQESTISRISGSGHSVPELPITTAWYLSRIEHPRGDVVNFLYEDMNYSYIASQSQTFIVPNPGTQVACENPINPPFVFPSNSTTLNTHLRHVGKRLVQIYSNNASSGKVFFNSSLLHPIGFNLVNSIQVQDRLNNIIDSIDLDFLFTAQNRVFLKSVQFLDPDKIYSLSYISPETFPSRLSFSQDHWGYFNGKDNSFLFPNPQTLGPNVHASFASHNIGADKNPDAQFAKIGMLEKVQYPTKGYTLFGYEGNTYRGEEIIEPNKVSMNLTEVTEQFQMGSGYYDVKTLSVPRDQELEINASAFFNSSACEQSSDVGKSKATFSIKNVSTGNYVNLYKISGYGTTISLGQGYTIGPDSSDHFFAQINSGETYEMRLTVNFECIQGNATIHYYDQASQVLESNISAGGVRIESMASLNSDGTQVEKKKYYYGRKEAPGISSADTGIRPYYVSSVTQRVPCETYYEDLYYLHLNSNSLRKLYKTSGENSTNYEYVTISYGGDSFENGGEEYQYLIHPDYFGNPLFGDPVETAPFTNFGWSNGLEKKKSIFKKDIDGNFVVLEETLNVYKNDPRIFQEVKAYAVEKKYNLTSWGDVTYNCKPEDLNKVFNQRLCTTNHSHSWGNVPLDGTNDWVCARFDANNIISKIYHPCWGKTDTTVIVRPEYIENLNITEYKSISYWHYLESRKTTKFDENGLNPIVSETQLYYDNPKHKLVSREETLTSDQKLVSTTTLYPQDIVGLSAIDHGSLTISEYAVVDNMKEHKDDGSRGLYNISTPIQVERLVSNGSTTLGTSVQRTIFSLQNGFVIPERILTSKAGGPLEDRVLYQRFDSQGNPLEILKKDGAPVAYIWGYNNLHPVAKVENATYAEIENLLYFGTGFNLGEGGLSSDQVASLRMGLPEAMVTTYSYQPLVGITSVTDPKGDIVIYDYDSFNRLEFIKDEDGNILKEHKYKFKTNP